VKPKTLALLALLVGGFAAFIFLYERELPGTDERRQRAGRLLPVEADQITSLEIEWQGSTVRFEREAAAAAATESTPAAPPPAAPAWKIVAPLAARADRAAVDRLAGDLTRLEVARSLADAQRAEVGLAPPRGKLTWKTADGEGWIEIGGAVPASQNVVVAAADRADLAVVPGWFVAELGKPAGDWRAREALGLSREAVRTLRLAPAGGPVLELARQGTGFAVTAPYTDAADRDRADPLLSDLIALRVERFLDPPLAAEAEAALAAPVGRIEIGVEGGGAPLTVEIGGELAAGGGRYLRVGGQAFEAKTTLAEALARDPEEWRSRGWTSFESFRVERLKISDRSGELDLARAGADWTRDGVKIPYPEVGDLLYALTSARAEQVLPPSAAMAYPPGSPTLTVTLADADGREEVLTLHAAVAEGVPARVSGRDVVLLLPGRVADEVEGKIAAIRAVKPLSGAAADEGEKSQAPAPAESAPDQNR